MRIPQGVDLERFLDRVSKALATGSAIYRVEGGTLKIIVYGSEAEIKETVRRIKQLLREYKTQERGGARLYTWKRIHRDAGGAIPLDALAQALRLQGHKARETGEGLETTAAYEEVAAAAQAVWEAMKTLAGSGASRSVKKAIAAAHAAGAGDPGELLEEALATGLAREEDDRIIPAMEWRMLSETLLSRRRHGLRGD